MMGTLAFPIVYVAGLFFSSKYEDTLLIGYKRRKKVEKQLLLESLNPSAYIKILSLCAKYFGISNT